MEIIYKGKDLTESDKAQIWDILCQCDDEFYPRLSLRDSSSQKDLSGGGTGTAKPVTYFKEMIQQDFILAYHEAGEVAGFMTFKRNYTCEALEDFGESLYITTVCVRKELRGRGIMKALYRCMENEVPQLLNCPRLTTRTWSLNEARLHELSKRGYERLAVLKDHRGPGVDTVYFGRKG